MQDVGRRISTIREALGWKAAHLARLAQIHRTELFHLEAGSKPKVTAAVMWRVVEALARGRREPAGLLYEEIWTGRRPSPPAGTLFAVEARLAEHEQALMDLVERLPRTGGSSPPSSGSTGSPEGGGRAGRKPGRSPRRSS